MSSPSNDLSGDGGNRGKVHVAFLRWIDVGRRHPWIFIVVLFAVGTTSVALVDATDYYFSRDNFCAKTCHVMESTVYQELQNSKHWNTPSGVRALCSDCHVSGRLTFAK